MAEGDGNVDKEHPTADAVEEWLKKGDPDYTTGNAAEQWLKENPSSIENITPESEYIREEKNFRIYVGQIPEDTFEAGHIFYRVVKTLGYPIQFSLSKRDTGGVRGPMPSADRKVLDWLNRNSSKNAEDETEKSTHVYVDSEDTYDRLISLKRLVRDLGGPFSRSQFMWVLIVHLYGYYRTRSYNEGSSNSSALMRILEAAETGKKLTGSEGVTANNTVLKDNIELLKRCYVTGYERNSHVFKSLYPTDESKCQVPNSLNKYSLSKRNLLGAVLSLV